MMTYKDDQGEPMNANAKNFLVMTSPNLWPYLAPAVHTDQITSGETASISHWLATPGLRIRPSS